MSMVIIQDVNNKYEFREEALVGLRDVEWNGPPFVFTVFTTGGKIDLIYDDKQRAVTAYKQISRIVSEWKK